MDNVSIRACTIIPVELVLYAVYLNIVAFVCVPMDIVVSQLKAVFELNVPSILIVNQINVVRLAHAVIHAYNQLHVVSMHNAV